MMIMTEFGYLFFFVSDPCAGLWYLEQRALLLETHVHFQAMKKYKKDCVLDHRACNIMDFF